MSNRLNSESITVTLPSAEQLNLSRYYCDKTNPGPPVFMLHSALQDGSSFIGKDGVGLAAYMAHQGYDVFVADLRGKGKSWPQVNTASAFGCHQAINEDIPALVGAIVERRGPVPQIWVGHGWGSVLMCSYYARYSDKLCPVSRMVHFAARRAIHRSNFSKRFWLGFMWRRLARLLLAVKGYMPAQVLQMGISNESRRSYRDYLAWSSQGEWRDTEDGYSYGEAIQQQQLPPSFYFAASADKAYGDPEDVRSFVKELGPHDGRLMVLSRNGGNLRNYRHLDMLQHKDCEKDHFPLLLEWLQ